MSETSSMDSSWAEYYTRTASATISRIRAADRDLAKVASLMEVAEAALTGDPSVEVFRSILTTRRAFLQKIMRVYKASSS